MPKGFTVRLPDAQVSLLATLATYDGVAIAEEIRVAVEKHIANRARDPEFVARVVESYRNLHQLLGKVDGGAEILEALGGEAALRKLERIHKIEETEPSEAAFSKHEHRSVATAVAAASRSRR